LTHRPRCHSANRMPVLSEVWCETEAGGRRSNSNVCTGADPNCQLMSHADPARLTLYNRILTSLLLLLQLPLQLPLLPFCFSTRNWFPRFMCMNLRNLRWV
jgi:hypothetical protein